ncbi:prolipoprotein diacylglyceryl transferase [Coprothermobacteraceae bacterium]|nr:prolipoprotein diacylglyceryl transferase [Coprothermobacteraceae bacterium]
MKKVRFYYGFVWGIYITLCLVAFQFFSGEKPIPNTLWKFHLYGVFIVVASVLAYTAAVLLAQAKGIDETLIDRFALLAIPMGLVGARLGFVLQNAQYYLDRPLEVIGINPDGIGMAGLSIHGVIVAGIMALVVFYGWEGLKALDVGDLGGAVLMIGQAFGRFGNFFNQELYGYPTNVPWKMYVDVSHRAAGYIDVAYYHPTFMYEGLLALAAASFLAYRFLYKRRFRGQMVLEYLIAYNAVRFVVEFYRMEPPSFLGLHAAQLVSIGAIALSIVVYALIPRFGRRLFFDEVRQTP